MPTSVGLLPWLRRIRLLSVTLSEAIVPILYGSIDLTKTHDLEKILSNTKEEIIGSFFKFKIEAPSFRYRMTAIRFAARKNLLV